MEAGLGRERGEAQLDDALLGAVVERVRPRRTDGHGQGWALLVAEHEQLKGWLVDGDLTVVKAHELLARSAQRPGSAVTAAAEDVEDVLVKALLEAVLLRQEARRWTNVAS